MSHLTVPLVGYRVGDRIVVNFVYSTSEKEKIVKLIGISTLVDDDEKVVAEIRLLDESEPNNVTTIGLTLLSSVMKRLAHYKIDDKTFINFKCAKIGKIVKCITISILVDGDKKVVVEIRPLIKSVLNIGTKIGLSFVETFSETKQAQHCSLVLK